MLCGETTHQLRNFTDLALLVRTREISIQRSSFRIGHQPGQLREPRRCELAHQRWKLWMTPAQRAERLEDRQIRLASAVLLDALTPNDEHARQLAEELLDERRLADAGI